jgi:hypothetical protein
MAALHGTYGPRPLRLAYIKKRDELVERLAPRPCIIFAWALVLVGLSIPLLMELGVLQPHLLLAFIGFALTITGGVLALVFCGNVS